MDESDTSRVPGTIERMAPPRKTYADRIADRSFLARRHHELLAEDELHPNGRWAAFQTRYRDARSDEERHEVALDLERVLRAPPSPLPPRPPRADVSHEDWRGYRDAAWTGELELPAIAELTAEARLPTQLLLEMRNLALERVIELKDRGEISEDESAESWRIWTELTMGTT